MSPGTTSAIPYYFYTKTGLHNFFCSFVKFRENHECGQIKLVVTSNYKRSSITIPIQSGSSKRGHRNFWTTTKSALESSGRGRLLPDHIWNIQTRHRGWRFKFPHSYQLASVSKVQWATHYSKQIKATLARELSAASFWRRANQPASDKCDLE